MEEARLIYETISNLTFQYRNGTKEDGYDRKRRIFDYLTSRGLQFEADSEGTDLLMAISSGLQNVLRLYPHEIYQQVVRCMRKKLI